MQPGEPFRLFLDLALRGPGSERPETVELTAREAAFVFETPVRLAEVAVDPDGWHLHELAATRPGTGSERPPGSGSWTPQPP